MTRRRRLVDALRQVHPELEDPEAAIAAGRVTVGGLPVRNPASMVAPGAAIALFEARLLRGALKLEAALDRFGVAVVGLVALDVGAAAGGFTQTLLDRGARRVYAVDAGWGQLLGSLRQDERVVNLERTNLGDVSRDLVPEPLDVVTVDLSYLSVSSALPQLDRVTFAAGAQLVALVKPMFELALPRPPTETRLLDEALTRAVAGISAAGWRVVASCESEVRGAGGTIELFVHATR